MRRIDADVYAFPGDLINEPTIDAVQVVRCKDCKYFKRIRAGYGECPFFEEIKDAEFCSSGERREYDGR